MIDKRSNLFDKCAFRCVHLSNPSGKRVHLFFLRGKLNVNIWQHSKFTEDANRNKPLDIPETSLRDIEILGWCQAGSVIPDGEKVPLKPWLATILVMVSR